MAVTMKQIAARSGLTQPAVSKILNGKAQMYRPETRQRVLEVARELGYRPNAAARAVVTRRFGAIAILLGTDRNRSALFDTLLDGIQEGAIQQDLHLTIAKLPDPDLTNEKVMPKLLREWFADGLLIAYQSEIPPALIALIDQYHIPAVWINSRQSADCVYPDELQAARQITERLLALGHRHIAYVNYSHSHIDPAKGTLNPAAHFSATDRFNGYATVMREAGLSPRIIANRTTVPRAQRVVWSRRWLEAADRPTAVIAGFASTALPVLHAAALSGLRVPEDLSLVAFHDRVLDDIGVRIATVQIPMTSMGRTAVEMLARKIDQPNRKLAPRTLAFNFEPGDTLAPLEPGSGNEPRSSASSLADDH